VLTNRHITTRALPLEVKKAGLQRNWTLRQDFGPSPRFAHTMCYDSKRGTLVLFGGFISLQSESTVADTWEHSEGP
jgi:hypothetical protein